MADGDTDDLPPAAVLHSDSRSLGATTLAILVLAGSAIMWRSLPNLVRRPPRHACTEPDSMLDIDHEFSGTELKFQSKSAPNSSAAAASDDTHGALDPESTKDAKTSRSKERRRRGKDPLKEMLKGAKKNKALIKVSRGIDPGDSGTGPSSKIPGSLRHSHETSLSGSSRSSSVSTPRKTSSIPIPDWAGPDIESNQGNNTEYNADTILPFIPSSQPLATLFIPSSALDSHHSKFSTSSQTSDTSPTPNSPSISLAASSSASQFSSTPSESVSTPNTSPASSPSGKTPTLSHPGSSSMMQRGTLSNLTTSPPREPSSRKVNPGPWDWDGAGPSGVTNKPPRFRTRSRNSVTTLSMLEIQAISGAAIPSSMNPLSPESSRGSMDFLDEPPTPFTFPTLNGTSTAPVPPGSPDFSKVGTPVNVTVNAAGHPPRRAPTPRRPPTPRSGTGTPPPSLSTQTQLASLRGALEAARMREEKSKIEIDKCLKQLEHMRYELAASRQREAELQTHLRHLHQQSYAAMFSSPLSSAHTASGSNLNGPGSSNAAPTSNGYTSASNSSPHIPSPAQMIPMLSPLTMVPPHLPFYPYSPASPHPHPHLHPSLATPSPHHQSNLYSMLYPPTVGGGSASGSSSVAGSSSAGSQSPDLSGSSSTTPPLASVHSGTHEKGEEGGDGWIVNGDEFNAEFHAEEDAYDDEGQEEEEESGFSEVLADAILKRPGSIRVLSRRKKERERERENVEHVEFTFPSISDFGNVRRANGVVEAGKGEGSDPVVMGDRAMTMASSEDTPKGGNLQNTTEPLPLGADDVLEESTG